MPRGSMRPEDGMKGGLGIQEGNVEVVSASVQVYQYPPNRTTGEQSAPLTALVLGVRRLNEEWAPKDEDGGLEQIVVRLGNPADLRPGKLTNPTDLDEEPEDLGSEVGTEGNSIYAEPDKRLGEAWVKLAESLIKSGFRADVIAQSYAPNYEGLKCHVKTEATGRTYKDKRTGEDKQATVLVVDRIHTHPYDKKGGGKGNPAKSPVKSAGTANVTGKAVQAPTVQAADTNGTMTPIERLQWLVAEPKTAKFIEIAGGSAVKRDAFQRAVSAEMMARKVKLPEQKALGDALKVDETLVEFAGECGFSVDLDEGTVQFG